MIAKTFMFYNLAKKKKFYLKLGIGKRVLSLKIQLLLRGLRISRIAFRVFKTDRNWWLVVSVDYLGTKFCLDFCYRFNLEFTYYYKYSESCFGS